MNNVNRFLLNYNAEQSALYLGPDSVASRAQYKRRHTTEIMFNKCMDGRVNVPPMTDGEVPMGIISPFRNMGGKFIIGSVNYAHYVRNFGEHVDMEMEKGTCAGGLVFTTYHFSKGSVHRGCKGFDYDTDAARTYTKSLRDKYRVIFGSRNLVIHPVQMGIETDHEGFIFHGDNSDLTLTVEEELHTSARELESKLQVLYPNMRPEVLRDLMPFVLGNQRHVKKIIEANRPPVEQEHREAIIAVGRGFDWLHLTNKALIVGPFSIGWLQEVIVAADIVLSNLKEGRISPEDGVVLLVSAPYREYGVDASVAREKATEMASHAWSVIINHDKVSELLKFNLELVVGTLDRNTMRFERLPDVAPRA